MNIITPKRNQEAQDSETLPPQKKAKLLESPTELNEQYGFNDRTTLDLFVIAEIVDLPMYEFILSKLKPVLEERQHQYTQLWFGKYNGMSLLEVFHKDRNYLKWWIKQEDTDN